MAGLDGFFYLTKRTLDDYGLLGVFSNLPPSFTVIPETTWRWGNAISALLIPQRGFLMDCHLPSVVFTQWWLAENPVPSEPVETNRKDQQKSS